MKPARTPRSVRPSKAKARTRRAHLPKALLEGHWHHVWFEDGHIHFRRLGDPTERKVSVGLADIYETATGQGTFRFDGRTSPSRRLNPAEKA